MYKKILKLPIRLYRYFISPLIGQNCRFNPTCSAYAMEAIDKLPIYKAVPKIIFRIIRCHPWNKGGNDSVL